MWKEVNILSTISEHTPSATLINVHVTNDLLFDKTSYHMCSGVEFVIIVFVYIYSLHFDVTLYQILAEKRQSLSK